MIAHRHARRQEAQDFNEVLDSKYFLRCLQLDISSFLRFSELNLGWQIITYFSCKHKSHFFLELE